MDLKDQMEPIIDLIWAPEELADEGEVTSSMPEVCIMGGCGAPILPASGTRCSVLSVGMCW